MDLYDSKHLGYLLHREIYVHTKAANHYLQQICKPKKKGSSETEPQPGDRVVREADHYGVSHRAAAEIATATM